MAGQITPLLAFLAATLVTAQNTSPENGDVSPENGGPQPTFDPSAPQESGRPNNQAGGSGGDSSYKLSLGGEIAIIVVVVVVAVLGIGSAVLFYIAKKRQWEVRATIRRASRRVASKVDLRPASRRQSVSSQTPAMKTPTIKTPVPRSARPRDLEKGDSTRSIPMTKTRGSPPRETSRSAEKAPAKDVGKTIDPPPKMPASSEIKPEAKPENGSRWKLGSRS